MYDCRLDHLLKRVQKDLITPKLTGAYRGNYNHTLGTQNLDISGENLRGTRQVIKYICQVQPMDHPSTHAHYQDIMNSLLHQQEELDAIQSVIGTMF